MKVVDYEPQLWFLFEEDGEFFLDGNYNHSFIGYDFMIQLSLEEIAEYRTRGREFINWLVEDIQNSAPILKASNSRYKDRRVPDAVSKRALRAGKELKE